MEMGEGLGLGRKFRDTVAEADEGCVTSRGLELVPLSGLFRGGLSVWDSQKEVFNDLGWVEEVVDDGLAISNEVYTPLAFREPGGEWNEEDKLVSGMSQEVSKWVLKRITRFSKFLGVTFDGFEERTMQLFSDIEEKWRKGVVKEAKRSGSWRANVVYLQETKLKEAITEVVKEIWGSWWIHLNAVGASGGGDSRVVEKIDDELGMFSASCLLKNVVDGFSLLFCNAEPTEVGYLQCVLLCFEVVTGLKVNLGKSEMIPVGVVDDIDALAQILGCRVASLPALHLGMPLGSSFKSKAVWDSVVERFQKRLVEWKRQYIPKGSRLILIKSTLSSSPTYFMSLFVIPVSVVKRLEKIQRDFLWGGVGEEFKNHLVDWDTVCTHSCSRRRIRNEKFKAIQSSPFGEMAMEVCM
ncbi:hypothetical protein RHMOL_Rhmol06G0116600 [Rhododendron molle]|uniref:Uncharacterized protein n=1 Tax=Rhododendron molle TaxID=49168 RepID=A0ACC0NDA7_RHOML|nr:hypothetical protein RHMOL_Rhmol06G0116600 [Rhododendron molle]